MEQGIYNKMQIKTKTIVVILILAVAFGFCEVRNAEAALWDFLNFSNIPKHPLLEKVEERQSIINGEKAITIIYEADNINISKVIDFYKDVLMQRGWKKSQEYLSPDYSVVDFTDEEMRVFNLVIARSPLMDGMIARVFYIPGGTKKWFFKESPEDNDMPGKDLDWFPRYPGTTRISSVEDYTGVTKIDYLVPGCNCVNCVVEFHKQNMLNNGWQLIGSDYQNKEEIQKTQANNASGMKKLISQLSDAGLLENLDLEGLEGYEESVGAQENQPSEIYSFHFEKKGDVCAIGIYYKEAQVGVKVNMIDEQLGKFREHSKEMGEEDRAMAEATIEEHLSKSRPYYFYTQMHKESVTVSVVYAPKRSMYSPSKRVRFRMKGAQ